jgi:hypothetical protein
MTYDVFNNYCYGIIAYFKTLRHLIVCFAVISLLACVNIYIFTTGNSLESGRNGLVASTTMGNLGFSYSNCLVQPLSLNETQHLYC